VDSLVNAVRTAVQTAATGGGGTSVQPPAVSTGSNSELILTSQTQVAVRALAISHSPIPDSLLTIRAQNQLHSST
jgi:hypothetical protein